MNKTTLISLLSFILFSHQIYSQLKLKINSEAGYYSSRGTDVVNLDNLLVRIDGNIGYKYEEENRNASISLRARPEFYSFKKNFYSIKLKADGDYYQTYESLSWGIGISRQRNIYDKDDFSLSYDIFNIFTAFTFYYLKNFPFSINIGYAFQSINENYIQNLDLYYLDIKFYNIISNNLEAGAGIYLEKFIIENNQVDLIKRGEGVNQGFRAGPQVSLNYIESFLINIDYKILQHISDDVKQPSFEQTIRLVGGFIFWNYWSIMFFAEYYTRNFKYNESEPGFFTEYIPINFENKIFLKIGYDISKNIEVFLKSGYFKDNIYRNRFSFSGWNSLIGFELRN